jgi:hypothetical protein
LIEGINFAKMCRAFSIFFCNGCARFSSFVILIGVTSKSETEFGSLSRIFETIGVYGAVTGGGGLALCIARVIASKNSMKVILMHRSLSISLTWLIIDWKNIRDRSRYARPPSVNRSSASVQIFSKSDMCKQTGDPGNFCVALESYSALKKSLYAFRMLSTGSCQRCFSRQAWAFEVKSRVYLAGSKCSVNRCSHASASD